MINLGAPELPRRSPATTGRSHATTALVRRGPSLISAFSPSCARRCSRTLRRQARSMVVTFAQPFREGLRRPDDLVRKDDVLAHRPPRHRLEGPRTIPACTRGTVALRKPQDDAALEQSAEHVAVHERGGIAEHLPRLDP